MDDSVNYQDAGSEFEALQAIIKAMSPLTMESRRRILLSVATFLGVDWLTPTNPASRGTADAAQIQQPARFSDDRKMSAKEFLGEKQPKTDVERIACLGYYLTHFRDSPHFKTIDLNTLNTEAAQPKFSNAAFATSNATKQGYLAQAPNGHKQISAAGEKFVMALPDRDGARQAMETARRRRKTVKRSPKATKTEAQQ